MSIAVRTESVSSHDPFDSVSGEDELTLRFDESSPLDDNFEEKVQKAQEKLLHLRQQQEHLERQKQELEELGQKQDRFLRGRRELAERLSRSLGRLDRETFEAQARVEGLHQAKDAFQRHLETIEAMQPEYWSRAELQDQLNHALSAIQDAEDEFARTMQRLALDGDGSKPGAAASAGGAVGFLGAPFHARTFLAWMLCGLAFTIPIMMFLAVFAVIRFFFGF